MTTRARARAMLDDFSRSPETALAVAERHLAEYAAEVEAETVAKCAAAVCAWCAGGRVRMAVDGPYSVSDHYERNGRWWHDVEMSDGEMIPADCDAAAIWQAYAAAQPPSAGDGEQH